MLIISANSNIQQLAVGLFCRIRINGVDDEMTLGSLFDVARGSSIPTCK